VSEGEYSRWHSLVDTSMEPYTSDEAESADQIEFIAHNGEANDAPRRHTVNFKEAYEATMYIYQHQALPPNTTWELAYV
jgi:hypothetical protein